MSAHKVNAHEQSAQKLKQTPVLVCCYRDSYPSELSVGDSFYYDEYM